ncbi:glycosyltransferase family 39 protein [Microseira sp. BLCC-F43]|jgi:4-amino-4-deoxy-L-arabinose transferase-like glycosyltransferase|uniref:glycosyltransferase family 39 protein n=1 Tax=Microseira sp. BLCC-F43 TaxID=3153602 RepID=UPI0035BA53B6
MTEKDKQNRFKDWLPLVIIWLVGAACDRIWFALDRNIPYWDQADYLTGTLNYWQALQHPQWFSPQWWTSFWQITTKVPPLTYIAAAIIQNLFGRGPDQATIVNLFFSAILLISVYGLGEKLFNRQVGLWAAFLCQVLPALYRYRLDFLLDYPVTAVVTFSFYCLTLWKIKTAETQRTQRRREEEERDPPLPPLVKGGFSGWFWAGMFGLSLGLALMVKQTALLFLLTPILWVEAGAFRQRAWGKIGQLIGASCLSVLVFGAWYRTNWLLMLTSGKRATIDSAIAEGDPALNTIDAWIYYWKILPYLVSWPLLLVPIVGILLYFWKQISKTESIFKFSPAQPHTRTAASFKWLAIFLVGGYLLGSLNINKDARYILPLLPVGAILLAYGLTLWRGRFSKHIRWVTASLAVILMLLNLWPIGGDGITKILSPRVQHYAYMGAEWPHQQVIAEIIKTEPDLQSTLGVLPSTPQINQHNFNYYGALANFQVYGRQVGTRQKHLKQDARSLSWFVTKTGEQGSIPKTQPAMVQLIEKSSDFELHKSWKLPDKSTLKLYHRRQPSVVVKPLSPEKGSEKIKLNRVIVPEKAPPGIPVPVTYEWSSPSEQLRTGLVLLTWRKSAVTPEKQTQQQWWLHDHATAMGFLYPGTSFETGLPDLETTTKELRVIEQTAMLPPGNITPGTYTLEAAYFNRQTGETYPIQVPPVTLNIDPTAAAKPAPELDLVTQLRILSAELPKGAKALESLFDQIGRINQYDPIQDYLEQAAQALEYRLKREPQNLEWAYGVALARVLQQRVPDAIAALQRVTQLDSQNPYAFAYLAFVNLYDWRPSAAQIALKQARQLNPNFPELQALSGVAALMQGNLVQAWHHIQQLTAKN